MALINCPECNKEISDKASFCPHCGYPLNNKDDIALTNNNCTYNVILQNYNGNKIEKMKSLREQVLHCDLQTVSKIMNNLPAIIKKNISLLEANKLNKTLIDLGMISIIVPFDNNQNDSQILNKYQEDVVRCPRCGSTSITTGQRGFSVWTGFLGSNKTVNRCAKCGYTWEPK